MASIQKLIVLGGQFFKFTPNDPSRNRLIIVSAGSGTPAGTFNYLRPGGVFLYRRPDTTSLYKRP